MTLESEMHDTEPDPASARKQHLKENNPRIAAGQKGLMNELKYWEAAYDRLNGECHSLQQAHDAWKQAHENVLGQLKQWEVWYRSLEADRDLYKKWESEKRAELEALQESLRGLRAREEHLWEESRAIGNILKERDSDVRQLKSVLEEEREQHRASIQEWETWYKSLEADRDLYKKWESEKRAELEALQGSLRDLQARDKRLGEESRAIVDLLQERDSDVRQLKSELEEERQQHRTSIGEWEAWYKNLEADRDLYKEWEGEKRAELEALEVHLRELRQTEERLRDETRVIVDLLQERDSDVLRLKRELEEERQQHRTRTQEWEAWYKSLEANRDLYKTWDEDKKREIQRFQKVVQDLHQREIEWQGITARLQNQVKQWEVWYTSLQADRELYKLWDSEKKNEINRLNALAEGLVQERETWKGEHAKVVEQIHQWAEWFQGMRRDRDQLKQLADDRELVIERQNRTIRELQTYLEKVFRNPLHYVGVVLHRIVGRKP